MQDDHSKSIETEQHRANDAETRLHLQAQVSGRDTSKLRSVGGAPPSSGQGEGHLQVQAVGGAPPSSGQGEGHLQAQVRGRGTSKIRSVRGAQVRGRGTSKHRSVGGVKGLSKIPSPSM